MIICIVLVYLKAFEMCILGSCFKEALTNWYKQKGAISPYGSMSTGMRPMNEIQDILYQWPIFVYRVYVPSFGNILFIRINQTMHKFFVTPPTAALCLMKNYYSGGNNFPTRGCLYYCPCPGCPLGLNYICSNGKHRHTYYICIYDGKHLSRGFSHCFSHFPWLIFTWSASNVILHT